MVCAHSALSIDNHVHISQHQHYNTVGHHSDNAPGARYLHLNIFIQNIGKSVKIPALNIETDIAGSNIDFGHPKSDFTKQPRTQSIMDRVRPI